MSEMVQGTTKVRPTIDYQEKIEYALSIGTKVNDLGWPWNDIDRDGSYMYAKNIHYMYVFRSQPLKCEWA